MNRSSSQRESRHTLVYGATARRPPGVRSALWRLRVLALAGIVILAGCSTMDRTGGPRGDVAEGGGPALRLDLVRADAGTVILIGTNSGDRPLVIDQSLVIDFELLLFGKDGVRIPCEYLRNPERPEPGAAAWRPRLVELPPGQSIRRRIRLDGYEVFVTYHSSTMKDGLVLHGPEMGQEIVCGLPSDVPAGVVHRIQVTHEGWRRNRDAIVQFTDLDPESIGLYEGRASAELTLAD